MEQVVLEEVKEYILRELPRVLEQDPRFVTFIEGIVAEKFPRRDEFARLLDEMQAFRQETNTRFDQIGTRFEQVDTRFEQVDTRFEQVDKRFEQVDTRLEQIDKRFEQVDKRFEQVDTRLEQIDKRFEQVDKRFEQLENTMKEGFWDLHLRLDRLGARWGIRNESVFRQMMKALIEESFGATVEEQHIAGEQFDCVIHNGKHILVEITASASPKIQERLLRKKALYTAETGVVPDRVVLVVGSIHSRRAAALREAGFEVIEPEEEA